MTQSPMERLREALLRLDRGEVTRSDPDVQEVFAWWAEHNGPDWIRNFVASYVALASKREELLLEDAARVADINAQRAEEGLPPIVEKGVDQIAKLGQMVTLIRRLGLLHDEPTDE